MNVLLLLMGGSGQRFGAAKPKQFIEAQFEGEARPIFEITVRKLLRALPIDIAILVSPKNTAGRAVLKPVMEKLKADFPGRKILYAAAGATRFTSFLMGLSAAEKFKGIERLLVHDANRPYLSDKFLQRVSSHMGYLSSDTPAFIPVVPVVDSIVRLDRKNVVHYENREELWRVQTPQLLHYPSFVAAQSNAVRRGQWELDFTDEGSVCLSLGLSVGSFEGDPENFKITFPEDLKPDKL